MLSRNLVWVFQGYSEIKYANLGKILHPQEFCLVPLEISTNLSAIAQSISALILSIVRWDDKGRSCIILWFNFYVILAQLRLIKCEYLERNEVVFNSHKFISFIQRTSVAQFSVHTEIKMFSWSYFFSSFFSLTSLPYLLDFIASSLLIHFVWVFRGREGDRSDSQVIGFVLYQVIQFSFQITTTKSQTQNAM